MEKMAVFNFRGKKYKMLLDLYALEMVEEEFGSLTDLMDALRNGKSFTTMRQCFRIFANAALEAEDKEETITGNEIKRATLEEMNQLAKIISQLIVQSSKTETRDGDIAGDNPVDLYEDDDEKN